MTVLYPNPCYNEVCYKGTALYVLITGILQVNWIKNWGWGSVVHILINLSLYRDV